MATPDDTNRRPPDRRRAPRRPRARRLAACLLIAACAALAAAPAASAATANTTPTSARVVLADPAPAPSPDASSPGIGLGPGAPTGAPTAPSPVTSSDPSAGGGGDPSWYDIPGQIEKAINDWFGSVVTSALTPMLNLLGATLLGTPDVTVMSGVTRIWTQMALLANALYILIILAGAVIVTTHGTMQSRFSAKEVVPRLAVGMIAGNASLGLIALMIHLADAIATAILGNTISPATAGAALGHQLSSEALGGGGIFQILLLLGGVVMLVAIILTYIVRVAITVILAVAAPLALSMHALPGADGMARMWWRAMTGCLLIQLGQTLAFVVALDVMLDPNANVSILGLPNNDAWVDPLVFIALCWILIKIPSWVMRSIFGPGSSKLSRLVKTAIAYKTLGALNLQRGPVGIPMKRAGAPNRPTRPPGPGRGSRSGPGGGPGRPGRSPGFRQIPIPFAEGRREMESRSTAGDYALARNALNRPDEPGTWLEEREAERRRRQRRGLPVEAPTGPRYRQEALFPRNAERIKPTGTPAVALTTASRATPGPSSLRSAPAPTTPHASARPSTPSTPPVPVRPAGSSVPPAPARPAPSTPTAAAEKTVRPPRGSGPAPSPAPSARPARPQPRRRGGPTPPGSSTS